MHSSEDQARQEVLSFINTGMKDDLFVDNENTFQATYLGSPLPSNDKDKPEGGMPSKIVDSIYDSTDNQLTGVGISFIVFSTLGVFSIILLLIRKRKQRRYLFTMEKLDDDDSFTDEEKKDYENDLRALSFNSTMDEDDDKNKNEANMMIVNNATSLTQESEEEESMMTRPASIISEPTNQNVVFHHLPSSSKKRSFLNSSPNSYRKPSMMKSKNSITFSKKDDGTNVVRKVDDADNPLFLSVNSPPFRGSYGKRG